MRPVADGRNTNPANTQITDLLHAHAAGDAAALEQLLPRVYGELRRIARIRLRRERSVHTLAATDLVHQAYLKLLPVERVDWRSRAHFFAIASRAIRNVPARYGQLGKPELVGRYRVRPGRFVPY